jgi:hypothetical protein
VKADERPVLHDPDFTFILFRPTATCKPQTQRLPTQLDRWPAAAT